jgi:hypothetical protein
MLPFENNFGTGNGAYIPSFDFELFDLPNFSPLQANEFGAFTSFSANTPTGFTDYSLDRLLGMLRTPNPIPFQSRPFTNDFELENMLAFFQSQSDRTSVTDLRDRLRRVRDEAQKKLEEIGDESKPFPTTTQPEKRGCNLADILLGRCTPAILSSTGSATAEPPKPMQSDGKGVLGTEGSKSIGKWIEALPQGTGIFLIGLVALVFLFLFARR